MKIGSGTLTGGTRKIDVPFMKRFVDDIASVHARGIDVVIVSSGAIRTGLDRLQIQRNNLTMAQKQAAAAVGQGLLIEKYTYHFLRKEIVAAQVLLTRNIFHDRQTYLNAHNTLEQLLRYRAVPVVNENDTVSYDEIQTGDNDTLSAITAMLTDADLLLLLSDVDGLFEGNPKEKKNCRLIETVTEVDDRIRELAGGPDCGGVGGMCTKVAAAEMATGAGIRMVIANGRAPRVVERIVSGERMGTAFLPKETPIHGRKRWIAFGIPPEGRIHVNPGARDMIRDRGKSLLATGITAVDGGFEAGACVEIGTANEVFARGLSNYSAGDIDRIRGRRSTEIKSILGDRIADEVVHRDNLVVLPT